MKIFETINNNSIAQVYLSLVDEVFEENKSENKQSREKINNKNSNLLSIYNYYKKLCDVVEPSLLWQANLGKYLGLKVFFERDLRDTNILEGYEFMGKSCEKALYQTLKSLYEINNQGVDLKCELQTPIFSDNANIANEFSHIYYMLENNPKFLSKLKSLIANDAFASCSYEMQSLLCDFCRINQSFVHDSFISKQKDFYEEQLKSGNIVVIPYCYADDLFINLYNKVSEEYRTLFHKMCECQLKQDLKTDNIHMNLLINKDNVLVYIVEKTKQKIKK